MAQLIVTVNRLNKRKSVPADFSDKSSVIGTVIKGFQFEGSQVTDMPNAPGGGWWRDRDGYYYWGGGVTVVDAVPGGGANGGPGSGPEGEAGRGIDSQGKTEPGAGAQGKTGAGGAVSTGGQDYFNLDYSPDKMSWAHEYLHIPLIWKDTKTAGKDIVVAVIDSGVDVLHEDLADAILPQSISINDKGEIDDSSLLKDRLMDRLGHGTQMAGMIAARGRKWAYGIAPQCKILAIKIMDNKNLVVGAALDKAFEWLSTKCPVNVDIISASLTTDELTDSLKANIAACTDKGMAVFSAIGDIHGGTDEDEDFYPSCCDNCTAIGSFDPSGALCRFSDWNSHLSLLAPGDNNLLTAGIHNSSSQGMQTSIATAGAAGCFSLLLSYLKSVPGAYKGRATDHLSDLYLTADDMGDQISRDAMHGYGRINLRNAISSVKNQLSRNQSV